MLTSPAPIVLAIPDIQPEVRSTIVEHIAREEHVNKERAGRIFDALLHVFALAMCFQHKVFPLAPSIGRAETTFQQFPVAYQAYCRALGPKPVRVRTGSYETSEPSPFFGPEYTIQFMIANGIVFDEDVWREKKE
ncbi:MAG: hypothetical protein WCV86_04890 [Patescibacteria group bacterium]|jgi:hypothetical protein